MEREGFGIHLDAYKFLSMIIGPPMSYDFFGSLRPLVCKSSSPAAGSSVCPGETHPDDRHRFQKSGVLALPASDNGFRGCWVWNIEGIGFRS